jgi:hypothetical protein
MKQIGHEAEQDDYREVHSRCDRADDRMAVRARVQRQREPHEGEEAFDQEPTEA